MPKFPNTYVFPDANGCDYYVIAGSREEAAAAINEDRREMAAKQAQQQPQADAMLKAREGTSQ